MCVVLTTRQLLKVHAVFDAHRFALVIQPNASLLPPAPTAAAATFPRCFHSAQFRQMESLMLDS